MTSIGERKELHPAANVNLNNVTISTAHSRDAEAVAIHEKSLLRKLDYRLLPPLTLLYLLSFLDRSNGSHFQKSILEVFTGFELTICDSWKCQIRRDDC
jgi:hypothetical protein